MECPNCGEQITAIHTGKSVYFKYFRGKMTTWESLFQQAADFATQQGEGNVISISHSEDHKDGVITVWYWG
ncbi:hypothetical protein Pla110_20830 [Polystyrenella longa]|uniref:Uncharacterized protein n=1 Tax=Polystyrenella longa TaxID=2528007 RepID=A0A518CM98_9PLAN|nr:hypothetical protein [Polystyrenella longa]QDU80356.1 hypothetical protein Pla110_20830 [Polystyrenella longa]